MNDKIYSITLFDGTVIDNLRLNGNNFISTTLIDSNLFVDNCFSVVINDGVLSEMHNNMELVQNIEVNGEYWFILHDISADELEKARMQSDIEYIAMMSEIDL